jgi:hypothetical protein
VLARLPGRGAPPPLLLHGHLDVVGVVTRASPVHDSLSRPVPIAIRRISSTVWSSVSERTLTRARSSVSDRDLRSIRCR